jgi:hypothetical protein
MAGLMGSLAATLAGRRDDAIAMMTTLDVTREPEVLFYLSRHCALLDAGQRQHSPAPARTPRRVLPAHTRSSTTRRSRRFGGHDGFEREIRESRASEQETRRALERAGIEHVLTVKAHA